MKKYKELLELEMHLTEYLEVMSTEPDGYILLSDVYRQLKRMLGDD